MAAINVSREQFDGALRQYRQLDMGEEDIALLEWFWGYAFHVLGGDQGRAGEALGYDTTTVYRVLKGTYQGSMGNVLEAMRKLRTRSDGQVPEMVETPVTRKIEEALNYARDFNALVVLRAPTGRGKTYVSQDWSRRNNHGKSPYVRCTAGMTASMLLRMVAKSMGVGAQNKNNTELASRIMSCLDRRHTLIVDEAGHLIPRGGRRSTIAIDTLRDLHDYCSCGLVLIITNVYWNEMANGNLRDFFEQFLGRVKYNLCIPEGKIFRKEIEEICHAFAGDRADEAMVIVAADIVHHDGGNLRTLFADFQNGARYAKRKGVPLDTGILKSARAWRKAAGSWNEETI